MFCAHTEKQRQQEKTLKANTFTHTHTIAHTQQSTYMWTVIESKALHGATAGFQRMINERKS